MEYPIPKQVKPKLNIAMRSDILIWHTPYYTIHLSPKVSQTNFPKGSKGEVKIKFYNVYTKICKLVVTYGGGWCYYIKKHHYKCKFFYKAREELKLGTKKQRKIKKRGRAVSNY